MDAFYHLATDDYRHLAQARDWAGFFAAAQTKAGDRSLRLLDVACGSGKFPNALVKYAGLAQTLIAPVQTALLDPSAFSIAEARAALTAPFRPAAEFQTTLQDFDVPDGRYDIVWATHALYAIPEADLETAIARFRASIAPGGVGIIAHSAAAGHYVSFHERYLRAFDVPGVAPYISAETIVKVLRDAGAEVAVDAVVYDSVAGVDAEAAVEGYLRRCVFDDTATLADMRATEPLATYLARCRTETEWRFGQSVWLMTISG